MSLGFKIGISITCGVLAFVLVALLACNYLHRRRKKNTALENRTTIEVIPMVSYKNLHKATGGFSQENLIGSGKFSSVYKGNLDEQGKVVAIKVLKLQVKGASKSFISECDALRHIRHRNLVKVLSSCSSIDYQGNAAPEYGMGSEFSTFGDAYSYGILLLEMFTRKSPTADIFSDSINLHNYVKMAIPHGITEISDPTLFCNKEDTTASSQKKNQISRDQILEFLLSIFRIGIACSVDSPKERMNVGTAINKLRSIRAGILATRGH